MASPSPKKPIILTAGHSNADPGAVAIYNNRRVTEAQLMTRLRDDVAKLLRQHGYQVITDGSEGQNLNLRQAQALLRQYQTVELELHQNGSTNRKATGVEAYSSAVNRPRAERFAASTARALDLPLRGLRGWKPSSESQHGNLAIVQAGGVLLEVCFLSNPNDYASFQRNYARLIQVIAFELAFWADGDSTKARLAFLPHVPTIATQQPTPRQPSFPVAPSPTHPQPVPPIYPEPAQRPPMQTPAIASGQPAARGVWATISAALVAAWSMGVDWLNAHMHQIGLAAVALAFVWLVWRTEQIKRRCDGVR